MCVCSCVCVYVQGSAAFLMWIKQDGTNNKTNYRGISFLQTVFKIFEYIVQQKVSAESLVHIDIAKVLIRNTHISLDKIYNMGLQQKWKLPMP